MMSAHTDEASRQRRELVGWFMRRHGPQWTPEDEQAFQRWLAAPANRQAYERWEADWKLMDAMPQAASDRLRAQVAADRRACRAESATPPVRQRRRFLAGGFALAGIAALAIAGGWLGWQHIQAQPVFEQAFSTRAGQLADVKLPDGSVLRLDTATMLNAAFFRRSREIRLGEGQAMFAVAADADRPFLVSAGPVRVTVVGTRFSVRLTPGVPGREGVEIEVEEGRVRVASGHDPDAAQGSTLRAEAAESFELSAGQKAVFDAQGRNSVLDTVAPDALAPWRNMQLSFSDVPLRQAVAELERYGNLGIAAIDPAAAGLRLSGTFDPRDPAATRRLLAATLPIKLVRRDTGWDVQPAR